MKTLITLCLLSLLLFPACTVHARTWYIKPDGTGDAPTIWAGIDSAAAGDSVVLACGTYFPSASIGIKSGIFLASETGSPECVTISGFEWGAVLFCDHVAQSTTIKGLTVTGGGTSIGSIGCGCRGGGMFIRDSSPVIVNCTFVGNAAGFINIMPHLGGGVYCENSAPVFVDCLFARNSAETAGGGMYCESSSPAIINCTFSHNSSPSGAAIFWHGGGTPAMLAATVVAFNSGGEGIGSLDYPGSPTLFCFDIYGNAGGDWVGFIAGQADVNGNFSLDPQFCDVTSDNYTLKQCSPCAPGNQPHDWNCGLIGALPVGCVGTTVIPTTWGRIKGIFR